RVDGNCAMLKPRLKRHSEFAVAARHARAARPRRAATVPAPYARPLPATPHTPAPPATPALRRSSGRRLLVRSRLCTWPHATAQDSPATLIRCTREITCRGAAAAGDSLM